MPGKIPSNLPFVTSLDRNTRFLADDYTVYPGLTTTVSFPLSTLSNAISPVVNVVDFGAKPDGSTNCTLAVSAAIASVRNGGTVFFPNGIYNFESALRIDAENVNIIHSKNSILRVVGRSRADMQSIYDLRYVNNVSIEGGTLSGQFNPAYNYTGLNTEVNLLTAGGISRGLISGWNWQKSASAPSKFQNLLFKDIVFTNSNTGACQWFLYENKADFVGNIVFDRCKFISGDNSLYFANYLGENNTSSTTNTVDNILITNCTFVSGTCFHDPNKTSSPYSRSVGQGGIPTQGRYPSPFAESNMKLEAVNGTNQVLWWGMPFDDSSIGYTYVIDFARDENHKGGWIKNLTFGGLDVRTFGTSSFNSVQYDKTSLILLLTSWTPQYGVCIALSSAQEVDPYIRRMRPLPFNFTSSDTISGNGFSPIDGTASCATNDINLGSLSGFRYSITKIGDGAHNPSAQGYNLDAAGGNSNFITGFGALNNFIVDNCSFDTCGRISIELYRDESGKNTVIRNCTFKNAQYYHLSLFGKGTYIYNNLFAGFPGRQELGGTDIYVTNNVFLSSLVWHANYGLAFNNMTIRDNLIIGNENWFTSIGTLWPFINLTIENNNFIQYGLNFDNVGCGSGTQAFQFNDVENLKFKNNSYTFVGSNTSRMGISDMVPLMTFGGRNLEVSNNSFYLTGFGSPRSFYLQFLGIENGKFYNNNFTLDKDVGIANGYPMLGWESVTVYLDNWRVWWKNPSTGSFQLYGLSGMPGATTLSPNIIVNSFFLVNPYTDYSLYPAFSGWNNNRNKIARCTSISPNITWEFLPIKNMMLYRPNIAGYDYLRFAKGLQRLPYSTFKELPKYGENNDCYLLFNYGGISNCIFENNNFTSYNSVSSNLDGVKNGLAFRHTPFFNTLFLNSRENINISNPALGLYSIKNYIS